MRRYTTVAAQVRAATEWPQPNALHFSQYTPPVSLALIGSHRAHQPAATRGGDFPLKLLLGREQVERGGRCPIASLQARFDCPLNEINSITIKYFVLFMADLELGDCGEIRAESGRGGHKNSTLLCPCFTFQGLATFWKRQIRNGGIIIRGSRQIPHRIKPELFFGHHKKNQTKKTLPATFAQVWNANADIYVQIWHGATRDIRAEMAKVIFQWNGRVVIVCSDVARFLGNRLRLRYDASLLFTMLTRFNIWPCFGPVDAVSGPSP